MIPVSPFESYSPNSIMLWNMLNLWSVATMKAVKRDFHMHLRWIYILHWKSNKVQLYLLSVFVCLCVCLYIWSCLSFILCLPGPLCCLWVYSCLLLLLLFRSLARCVSVNCIVNLWNLFVNLLKTNGLPLFGLVIFLLEGRKTLS